MDTMVLTRQPAKGKAVATTTQSVVVCRGVSTSPTPPKVRLVLLLYCIILYCVLLHCLSCITSPTPHSVVYCIALYCLDIVFYYIVSYCIVPQYIALFVMYCIFCIVLYCMVMYFPDLS